MLFARGLNDRVIKENLKKSQSKSLAILDAIQASFRRTTSEFSRKVSELSFENAMLEAALSEARKQVQALSTTPVIDAIKQNSQAWAPLPFPALRLSLANF